MGNLNPSLWDVPHSESTKSNSTAGISSTGGPDRHSTAGFHPNSESTNPICQWITPPTSEPYQVCRYCWWDYPHSDTAPQAYQSTPN